MKQVALLGGSFNPPHVGHLLAAMYLRSVIGSDEVWLVPSFHHPFGKALTTFENRVAMCEVMAQEIGPWLQVSRAEEEVGGEGRTIELLEFLIPRHREVTFRFVIGSDILLDLPKWKAWDKIQKMVPITILHRAGHPSELAVGPPLAEVSSTQIRSMLSRGEMPTQLVPSATLQYIQKHQLFLAAGTSR